MTRRRTLLGGALGAAASFSAPALVRAQAASARIVIVGGGFGGAAVARHLLEHVPHAQITLVEPATRFYTCPFSNRYLGGLRTWESIGHSYDGLRAAGATVVRASAQAVDGNARTVRLSGGQLLRWDKLVLSPGIDMRWDAIEGYDRAAAERIPHAWKAGPQTRLLHRQLRAMPDGGTFIMTIPDTPFRCPPAPYERAAMVAHYFKRHKPRSKILLLDAKNNFSMKALFLQGWKALYGEMIEWISLADDGQVERVDPATLEIETFFGTRHKASVLNVIPPQKAGFIAERAGVSADSGWVPVKGENFESARMPGIHVLGDAAQAGPMPKSASAAHSQGKVVAAWLAADLLGKTPPGATYPSACYSLIGPDWGISIIGTYEAHEGEIVNARGGVSTSRLDASAASRVAEAARDAAWYAAISRDIWDR